MNYWILTVTNQRSDGRLFTQEEIFHRRMKDEFWGLGDKTPNRKNLDKGDRVVFYLGNPVKSFAGTATLSTSAFELQASEQEKLSHGLDLYKAPFGVRLEDVQIWDRIRSVEELLPDLDFIENKEFWGPYFQGGVRHLSEKDYATIVEGRPATKTRVPESDFESEAEFVLETHLEEFLDSNWQNIDFGSRLEKYQVEDQNGRQFPLGPWSADFLCVDKTTGDFVVIELKRGKTSDATVGQILRYIAFVRENLGRPDQNVRGIIIAREVDEALRYAIKALPNVEVRTYKIDFKLSPLRNQSVG